MRRITKTLFELGCSASPWPLAAGRRERSPKLVLPPTAHRTPQPAFLLAVLLIFATASLASAQVQLREKGWDTRKIVDWTSDQAAQPFRTASSRIDCADFASRRDVLMNGNKITSQIFNFGSISAPGNTITDIVWNGLGYGYEFGPFVAAEIIDEGHKDPQSVLRTDADGNPWPDENGDPVWVMHIVSDGIVSNGGEVSPDNSTFWGWQPIPCAEPVGGFEGIEVVEPTSDKIPTSDAIDANLDGKPDSWPDSWYNENIKEYVWPGALQQGSSNADKEGMFFMNDYANAEFAYEPFESDSTIRGMGLEVETRLYQWSNPLAEDAIFLVYKISNKSEKDLDKVTFGMWGDPHIGGPGDWFDDLAFFDQELNMVFAFDADGRSDVAGKRPGYFGYKFLESPGLGNEVINGQAYPGDGIDNDADGYIDESWTDGIDNDGDWDAETDDVGEDGVAGTGDAGEGDGFPTSGDPFDITRPGEPNFEFTDIDESDMIGLTSFTAPPFGGNRISNDERVWQFVQPGRFDNIPEDPGDYVFLYGSGSFPLRAGETKRFSIALIVGESLEDLTLNAETVQQIFDVGYRFAKPPAKPSLTAVPGDKKVTLYWDDVAEASVDPLSREQDFEGYAIYRSVDNEFADQQTITDINGSAFLFSPLKSFVGVEAKFDKANGITGPSPIAYPKRGVSYDLGDDTGLFHTYVDSNNVRNGQTYYYTVAAYDRGFAPGGLDDFVDGIAPTETSKTITYNPVTDSYIYDKNTASVVPGPKPTGYVSPDKMVEQLSGLATGEVVAELLNPLDVPTGGKYRIDFMESTESVISYDVIDDQTKMISFIGGGAGKATGLGYRNIDPDTFSLVRANGTPLTNGSDYQLNPSPGSLELIADINGEELTAIFKYRPIVASQYVQNEEANIVFDGIHLRLRDDRLQINDAETGWSAGGKDIPFEVRPASAGPNRTPYPSDYEIVFSSENVGTSISSNLPIPFRVINISKANQEITVFVPDLNRNGVWDVDESLIFVEDLDGVQSATWEINLGDVGARPGAGDVFFIKTDKPFTGNDSFLLTTSGAASDSDAIREGLSNVYAVPNPYVATNEIEPRNPISRTQRGERRMYFANVPPECTIRIYTVAGELVDTIVHQGSLTEGKAFWDLRTKDNMNVAYGLYIFHVEAPEGEYVGKFAVIK